jgi:hypothetical protein
MLAQPVLAPTIIIVIRAKIHLPDCTTIYIEIWISIHTGTEWVAEMTPHDAVVEVNTWRLIDLAVNIEIEGVQYRIRGIEVVEGAVDYVLEDQEQMAGPWSLMEEPRLLYNIRPDQSYRRDDLAEGFWPLADPAFRHALIHGYDQLGIIPPIYGFIVTPVRSLVPPAQSYWYNSAVPTHDFNLGNPFTSPPGEHSTCGILKDAGYVFVDADSSSSVTAPDY